MRGRALCVAAVAVLCLAACGNDSDSETSSAATAENTTQAATGDAAITAKEFGKLSIPDELGLIERLADANPDACSGVNPRSEPFHQAVFINAAQARPDTLISDLVGEACEAG